MSNECKHGFLVGRPFGCTACETEALLPEGAPVAVKVGCRACSTPLELVWDLGKLPLANAFVAEPDLADHADRYPLRLCVCRNCDFVQLNIAVDATVLFGRYAYSSPSSPQLRDHYATLIGWIVDRQLCAGQVTDRCVGTVFEMGSNTGDFLRAFSNNHVTVYQPAKALGIEPAVNIAAEAETHGVRTAATFFSRQTVDGLIAEHGRCNVFVARHCLAHLDDLRGTLEAAREILEPNGLLVIENAYLLDTLRKTQFDQLYHEHMSYFAARPMTDLLASAGFDLEDVRLAPVHGGSICLFARKGEARGSRSCRDRIATILSDEVHVRSELDLFRIRSRACLAALNSMIVDLGRIDAYGASAKGTMLLNQLSPVARLRFGVVVDSTHWKHDLYVPGTRIRVVPEDSPEAQCATTYLLTAWNYADEIMAKAQVFRGRGGNFLVPVPYPQLRA